MNPLKIILVDDNEIFRNSLKELLVTKLKCIIIGEASGAKEFWELNNIYSADIVLMDLMMPEVDGFQIAKKILLHNNKCKILAITMHVDTVYLEKLIGAGFMGGIYKGNLFNELETALKTVMSGKRFYPEYISLSNQ